MENKQQESKPKNRKRDKLKGWVKRYLPAELVGTIAAVTASYVTFHSTGQAVVAAYMGTLGETLGFYSAMFIISFVRLKHQLQAEDQKLSAVDAGKLLKHLLLEFGPAEILDSFLIRPFFMYFFPTLITNYAIGVFIGKIASDLAFYLPVITSYEMHLRHQRKRKLK